jgi:general secretion pathway protein E
MLTSLNTEDRKIITLEDPIEYELSGIVQSEVDEKKNYTYSSGLKALMRQDPDVIMIGEIRDLESATIAMQAAMTGHLVLSTLHTKSA